MPAVAADIARIVMISTRRRPMRSPMWLKKMPPSGRAKYPTANTLNDTTSDTIVSVLGKKFVPM
jgi:hypothetical protein